MGRAPCCDKANVKKGPWSPEEDAKLKDFIEKFGTGGNWIALPQKAGLKRCGKSCRLRWLNYLRPNIKHGEFTDEEDRIICTLYATIGSRWSIIAAQLPGRTDNDIKNYWNTKLKKKLMGVMLFPPPSSSSSYNKRRRSPVFSAPTNFPTNLVSFQPLPQQSLFSFYSPIPTNNSPLFPSLDSLSPIQTPAFMCDNNNFISLGAPPPSCNLHQAQTQGFFTPTMQYTTTTTSTTAATTNNNGNDWNYNNTLMFGRAAEASTGSSSSSAADVAKHEPDDLLASCFRGQINVPSLFDEDQNFFDTVNAVMNTNNSNNNSSDDNSSYNNKLVERDLEIVAQLVSGSNGCHEMLNNNSNNDGFYFFNDDESKIEHQMGMYYC
ncbi:unnamed protein product [Cuscuta epithymum]|uniref:Uncharacterized protein n=1 Tax=Cuscuta epithymum TaxID=186058 RepID=A0AAV0CPU7_9ASTE|nr:unnamed protein product [Cuscuta epithymum]